MDWQQVNGRYTLQRGTCTAAVWPTERHGYGAMVSYAGISNAKYGFAKLDEAQAWCITQLAKARQAGKCGE